MPDNEVNIVISATDKASASLKGVSRSIITLNQGLELAQKAFSMVRGVVEESVGAYVKYADQVRRLQQLNGTSAQETSRLIQLTDDHKVSVEALTMATRKLSQQGLSLTIDSLAKMSDEYLSLGSNAEKTRFLLDKFGRSGLQFAETMEQGGEAIKQQSTAISQNLILTQQQLVAARNYEKQLDELNDTVMGFKVALGSSLLPVLLKATDAVKTGMPAWADMDRQLGIIADRLVQSGNPALLAFGRYMEWIQSLLGMGKTDVDSATKGWIDLGNALQGAADAAAGTDAIGDSVDGLGDSISSLRDAEEAFLLSTINMTPKAVAEFVTIQTKIEEVKKLIAAGASFNVIVNFLAGRTIMVDPSMGMSMTSQQWSASQAASAQTRAAGAAAAAKTGGMQTTTTKGPTAYGGMIPAGGMSWVGDTPSGLTPHSELVYAPQGAYVFNASQSRSIGGGGTPRAFMGGTIPGMSGETNLSSSTIRQLANEIAGAMARQNG